MSGKMIAPEWMHSQITVAEYESWSEEQCAGIEIVDGMVVVSPSASKRQNRLARILANAFDVTAGPDWNADTDFDVRLQDVPLTNRHPDVVVYLPARLCQQSVPGRRGIHRTDQGHRSLPGRDRSVGSLVTARAALTSARDPAWY
jgi:hypothetical protein